MADINYPIANNGDLISHKAENVTQLTGLDGRIDAVETDTVFPAANIITNGDFSDGTTGWTLASAGFTVDSGNLYRASNVLGSTVHQDIPITQGHIIYFATNIIEDTKGVSVGPVRINYAQNTYSETYANIYGAGLKTARFTASSGATVRVIVVVDANKQYRGDNFIAIDLTSTFGAGNEPTTAEMDAILSYYPNSWFDGTINLAANPKMLPYLLKAIRAKADKVQEEWITPTLLNGWTEVSEYPVRYMKDQFGFVHFKGRILGGTTGTLAFMILAGYRPLNHIGFLLPTNAYNVTLARAYNDLMLQYQSITSWVDISSITYKAEQ